MITLTRFIEATLDSIQRRIIKVRRNTTKDILTAKQIAPFGIDSGPIKDLAAILADTQSFKDRVIIGYVNESQEADVGELRLYSMDEDGNVKAFGWFKNDGTILINGDSDNVVRYAPLNTGLQALVTQLQAELVKIQTGIIAGGGTYTPGSLSIDITQAKIEEVKTSSPAPPGP